MFAADAELDVGAGFAAAFRGDLDEFADAIRGLMANVARRDAMVAAAYQLVLQRFSWDTIADSLMATIEREGVFDG